MSNSLFPTWLVVAWRRLDMPLLVGLFLLILLGLVTLYSASGGNWLQVQRQMLHFAVGFVLLFIFAQLPSNTLRQVTVWLYGAGLALLVLVLLFGVTKKGATRWLNVGVDFQPSEIMKLAVPMMVAYYFAEKPLPPRWVDLGIALVIVAVPMALVMKQPDLGTSLLIGAAGLFAIYLAGLPWWLVSILGGGVALGLVALFAFSEQSLHFLEALGMHGYQLNRVRTFLYPESDLEGTGYHISQSKIAIGSGGIDGKGWMQGDQAQLDFLPERHTDFIFAVFGEEFGWIGNLFLLGLYLFIVARSLYLASKGDDTFARLLAGSLTLSFFFYLFVNTGMVTGLLPVVGVPLPLVSYGGTSVVTLMMAFGIIMGMQRRRRMYYREG